jgi:hypothetical protein
VVPPRNRWIDQMRAGNRHRQPSREARRTPSSALPGARYPSGAEWSTSCIARPFHHH